MKSVVFYIVTLYGIFSLNCLRHEETLPRITYNDSAYVKIIAENIIDTLKIQTDFCSIFPFRNCYRKEIIITKPGNYFISYKMTKPELVHFTIKKSFTTMVKPKDTLVFIVGFKSNQSFYLKTNDEIYKYYKAKFEKFGYYTFLDQYIPAWEFLIKSAISIDAYKTALGLLDAGEIDNIDFLEKNRKNLPNWFIEVENANIVYGSASNKVRLLQKLSSKFQIEEFPIKVDFNNSSASLSSFYYAFIMNYLYFKCPLKAKNLSGAALYIGNFLSQYQSVDTLLNGKIKDYYVTCRLSDLYYLSNTTEDFKMVDSFIKRLDFSLSKDEYKFIDQEKNFVQKMLNIKYSLEPGTKAPGFYLKDEKGIVHNLSDYTGKIVYIHFWATWCEPCIKEIPSINQLHMKLINQPFEIINICLNDNVEKWRQIIEKEGLKGTNLICIGNWGNLLKNKYFITELPHFTLIDKNGIIIKNFSEGPGNISTDLIGLINI